MLLGQEVGDQLVGDGKEQALEESRLLVTLFLVAHAVGTAKEHHLILSDDACLFAARQSYLTAQYDIEQMLFEEERTLIASRSDALVNDAAAVENKRRGGIVARYHRSGEFDNPVHSQQYILWSAKLLKILQTKERFTWKSCWSSGCKPLPRISTRRRSLVEEAHR